MQNLDGTIQERRYIPLYQQQQLIGQLHRLEDSLPIKDRVIYSFGWAIAGCVQLIPSILLWRYSFRAFNLERYGRHRFTTLVVGAYPGILAAMTQQLACAHKLVEPFRSEEMWTYTLRSFLTAQACTVYTSACCILFPFMVAQRIGMIRVDRFYWTKENRKHTFEFIREKVLPYKRRFIRNHIITSCAFALLGAGQFWQSQQMLARLGRKTLSHDETTPQKL